MLTILKYIQQHSTSRLFTFFNKYAFAYNVLQLKPLMQSMQHIYLGTDSFIQLLRLANWHGIVYIPQKYMYTLALLSPFGYRLVYYHTILKGRSCIILLVYISSSKTRRYYEKMSLMNVMGMHDPSSGYNTWDSQLWRPTPTQRDIHAGSSSAQWSLELEENCIFKTFLYPRRKPRYFFVHFFVHRSHHIYPIKM